MLLKLLDDFISKQNTFTYITMGLKQVRVEITCNNVMHSNNEKLSNDQLYSESALVQFLRNTLIKGKQKK